TRSYGDWSSDVCSSDLFVGDAGDPPPPGFEGPTGSADGLAEWAAPKPLFNGKLEGVFPELDRHEDEIVVHLPPGTGDSPLWISRSEERRVGTERSGRGR